MHFQGSVTGKYRRNPRLHEGSRQVPKRDKYSTCELGFRRTGPSSARLSTTFLDAHIVSTPVHTRGVTRKEPTLDASHYE